jgi:glycosyltransferase involved in cell wall biosynthesis
MVVRFDPIKRVDTLLQAAHALNDPNWHVDLVGDGPQRSAIEALISKLEIADHVTLHGWVANPYPLVKASAALVLCSEYEGFSNSVLESMVIGTPVLTSFCSHDARDMHDSGAALGFDVGDWRALSQHMARIMSDRDLRISLRRSAQAYASRHHLDLAVREYQALLHAACDDRA